MKLGASYTASSSCFPTITHHRRLLLPLPLHQLNANGGRLGHTWQRALPSLQQHVGHTGKPARASTRAASRAAKHSSCVHALCISRAMTSSVLQALLRADDFEACQAIGHLPAAPQPRAPCRAAATPCPASKQSSGRWAAMWRQQPCTAWQPTAPAGGEGREEGQDVGIPVVCSWSHSCHLSGLWLRLPPRSINVPPSCLTSSRAATGTAGPPMPPWPMALAANRWSLAVW